MSFRKVLLSQLSLNSNATSYIFSILLSSTVILINFIIVKGNPTNNTFKSVLAGFCIYAGLAMVSTGKNKYGEKIFQILKKILYFVY